MKITLTGSLGNIGKPLTQLLVNNGHTVTVISTQPERAKEIEALGAKAAIGTVADKDFLTSAFTGADLVYTMLTPVNYSDPNLDMDAVLEQTLNNFTTAIRSANVKRVIHLSSIGAHMEKGNGLLALHHKAETFLKTLSSDIHLTFMRPTGFYYNLFGYINMIKHQNVIAANYGAEDVSIWVAPDDIATAIAEEVETPSPAKRSVRYVASEEIACKETASLIGEAIGKPDLQWVIIPGEQMLNGLTSMGMKPEIAAGLVEMYAANHSGVLYEDYYRNRPVLGKIKTADFAKQFAAVYSQNK